jgi:AcrR family transcriptional regulator
VTEAADHAIAVGLQTDGPRARLLDLIVEHVTEAGITDLTLRSLAAAIGTSHQLLNYHFGGRDELIGAVMSSLRADMVTDLRTIAARRDGGLLDVWRALSEPTPRHLLLFQCIGLALTDPNHYGDFASDILQDWMSATQPLLVERGLDPAGAETLATLVVAAMRGLSLDMLATGDTQRTEAAVRLLETLLPSGSSADATR